MPVRRGKTRATKEGDFPDCRDRDKKGGKKV